MGGRAYQNGIPVLRVLATLLVAAFHFELSYPFCGRPLLRGSFLCVEFFFVLSGFLAAGSTEGKWRHARLREVIADRWIRLWPAYLWGLILMPMVFSAAFFGWDVGGWFRDGTHLPEFLAELLMVQTTGVTALKYVNGPGWYVSALFLTTPLLVLLLQKGGRRFGLLSGPLSLGLYVFIWTVSSPSMSSTAMIGFFPVPLLRAGAGLLAGAFLYHCLPAVQPFFAGLGAGTASALELLGLACFLRMLILRQSNVYNGLVLIPIAFLILLLFSENRGILSRLGGTRTMQYLSEISYCFYILQSFCSNVFTCLFPRVGQPQVTVLYFILNFIWALVLHELWEKPVTGWLLEKKAGVFRSGGKAS